MNIDYRKLHFRNINFIAYSLKCITKHFKIKLKKKKRHDIYQISHHFPLFKVFKILCLQNFLQRYQNLHENLFLQTTSQEYLILPVFHLVFFFPKNLHIHPQKRVCQMKFHVPMINHSDLGTKE